MLYELRRYDVAAGKLPALVDGFGSVGIMNGVWRRGGRWRPWKGAKGVDLMLDAADLLRVGELRVANKLCARPDGALFDAPMPFVIRHVLRGGNAPSR